MSPHHFDLIVIGAGISGLVAARFYLDIHPHARLVILERDGCVGGVWSRDRVYPGFKSQGTTRLSGFSDRPFDPPKERVDRFDMFDSKCMADYLENYVDDHVYDGVTMRDRIQFNTPVSGVEKVLDLWNVYASTDSSQQTTYIAPKLIVASGFTSVPNEVKLIGQEEFGGPIIHQIRFGSSRILEMPDIKKIAVIGGGKSAADMVYGCVKAGKEVNWIIRKSGKGPGAFVVQMSVGPYRNAAEAALSRLVSSLIPSGLGTNSWWSWFYLRTRIGQWIFRKFDQAVSKQSSEAPNFDGRKGARKYFKNLKTDMMPMWLTVPVGVVHYDDFWDTIAQNVDVYRSDIDRLESGSIHLKEGESIEADAILCGTGFIDNVPFFTESQRVELGLPYSVKAGLSAQEAEWASLEEQAEKEVLERLPFLASPPQMPGALGDIPNWTPYRLYNTISPIKDTSVAFVGFAILVNMFAAAEVEAIWVTALFDGNVKLPDPAKMQQEVAWTNAYLRLRCPTYGKKGNWYIFDFFPYIEKLLGEVGLSSYRKGWWDDLVQPFITNDLTSLKEEYVRKYCVKEVAMPDAG